jgi:CheY-like chemotaxis protein
MRKEMKNQRAFAKFTQNMEPLVLIVDEDEMMREMLMVALRSEGFRSVYPVSTASEALRFTRELLPDLLIIDYELSHTTGLQLYDQIHQTRMFQPIPGILVSAPFLSEEVKPRPLWIVQEPFDLDTFFASVRQAILVSSPQSAKVSSKQLKEVMTFMRAKQSSLLSAVHVLSLGFFCGLLLIPLGGLLLRSLILYYREKRKESMPPVTLNPLVKTERGMVIQVIPRSLVENEREAARLPAMAR